MSCTTPARMQELTLLASLPDTTALVVVGTTLIALALLLKKRLLSGRVEPTATHGSSSEL
jgi:hypothetical protein